MRPTPVRFRRPVSISLTIGLVTVLLGPLSAGAQQAVLTEDEFVEVIRTEGIEVASEQFRAFRTANPDGQIFPPTALNGLGYEYLRAGDAETAVAIFALNIEAYPEESNQHDSLGEALMVAGDIDGAIASYERSVELDPENTNGLAVLERIRG